MTPEEEKELVDKLNSLGIDHLNTCHCDPFAEKDCKCEGAVTQIIKEVSQLLQQREKKVVDDIIKIIKQLN